MSDLLMPISPRRRLNGALTFLRDKLLTRAHPDGGDDTFDEFVLEAFLVADEPAGVFLEMWNGAELGFREAIVLQPGENFATLPAARLLTKLDWSNARLCLYPEHDAELRLIFSWLDFVKYRDESSERGSIERGVNSTTTQFCTPAAQVKCVAWDLDNTLWSGVLVEDGARQLALRPGVAELVRSFDERGILQTIVSKNDAGPALNAIQGFGLADYFLFPAINWGSKSANLRQLAEHFNLGIDTFALVDDSAFERAEVQGALPMVRVYSEREIEGLLDRPEFDVPVTDMSRLRRASYMTEARRSSAQQLFPGDYVEFLRACGMKLRVFTPRSDADALRCFELLQRSNQLNLSSRRFTREEFVELLHTPGMLNVALECLDKFGNYGVVGFVSVDEREETPRVTNFVLSCRVVQKRVEHAFFGWLAQRQRSRGCSRLLADLVVTSRNGPLAAVFGELGFVRASSTPERVLLELSLTAMPSDEWVVAVTVELGT